jgi:hypothetical protein
MRHTRKQARRNRKSTRRSGGAHRVFYGKITDAEGRVFTDADFLARGDTDWQKINTLLSEHVKKHFGSGEIIQEGFGGDDGSGTVVVKTKGALPPMTFTAPVIQKYTISFDRQENNNS